MSFFNLPGTLARRYNIVSTASKTCIPNIDRDTAPVKRTRRVPKSNAITSGQPATKDFQKANAKLYEPANHASPSVPIKATASDLAAEAPKVLPIFYVNYQRTPFIADSTWQAMRAGWPSQVTYRRHDDPKKDRREKSRARANTMRYFVEGESFEVICMPGSQRDEYPYACTEEGASSELLGRGKQRSQKPIKCQPFVSIVPETENRVQGGDLSAFTKKLSHGDVFLVLVVGHPNDSPLSPEEMKKLSRAEYIARRQHLSNPEEGAPPAEAEESKSLD